MARKTPAPAKKRPRQKRTTGNGWERRILLSGLVGSLWLSVIASWTLTLQRIEVPKELYYIGTASFGALAALIWPQVGHQLTGKGGH